MKSNRLIWKIVSMGVAMGAGAIATSSLRYGWKKVKNEDPPDDVGSPDTDFKDALMWTLLTGLGVAVIQLLVSRGITKGWEEATGELPPA